MKIYFARSFSSNSTRFFFALSLSFFFLGPVAIADELSQPEVIEAQEPSFELPQILVIGSAFEENEAQLPASATVFRAEELQTGGVDFFQNQIIEVPNLNFSSASSRPRFFQIRGVGDLEQYEGAPNSSVALIVDDVDLTGLSLPLTLFDVSQLEVHRGPQATRFGSSALAGAIHLQTAEPEQDGQLIFSAGSDDLFNIGAAAGAKVSEGTSARISLFGHRQDGFRNNVFLGEDDTNKREEFTGRFRLNHEVSKDLKFSFRYLGAASDNGFDAFNIANNFTNQSDRPGEDSERVNLFSIRTDYSIANDLRVEAVTSYYESDLDYSFDGDWGSNPFWSPFDPYDFFSDTDRSRESFAQQIRLISDAPRDEVRWSAGMFFETLDEDTETREFSDNQIFDFLSADYSEDTYAGFASVDIPLSEELSLRLSARGEQREMTYRDSRGARFSPDDFMWGGSASLEYGYSDDALAYLLVSRGFRGGGFNPGLSIDASRREYSPESLVNLELGQRAEYLGGRLRTSTAAFVNFRREQQLRLAIQVDPDDPLSFNFITDNAARGRSYGLESEVDYSVSPEFALRASGSLLKTEITSIDPLLASLEGRDQSHAPRWQYSLVGEYFLLDALSLELGVNGRASFYFDDSHDAKSSPFHLVNANLRYYGQDWELSLWARNLFDERYATRGFFFGLEPPDFPEREYVQLGDPLAMGLSFRYFFPGA